MSAFCRSECPFPLLFNTPYALNFAYSLVLFQALLSDQTGLSPIIEQPSSQPMNEQDSNQPISIHSVDDLADHGSLEHLNERLVSFASKQEQQEEVEKQKEKEEGCKPRRLTREGRCWKCVVFEWDIGTDWRRVLWSFQTSIMRVLLLTIDDYCQKFNSVCCFVDDFISIMHIWLENY